MSKKDFVVPKQVPLPPKNAEKLTTACDYCIVACGYNVYRWPVGQDGRSDAKSNIFGVDYPIGPMQGGWVSANQHNIVSVNGKPHNIVVVADSESEVVNVGGNHSIRGGTIAKKCYNPTTETKDRLKYPMLRVNGQLERISWDDAFDIMTSVSKHVIKKHGKSAWALKTFSYQFWENTYAITKLALRDVQTPAFAVHDQPTGHGSDTPGLSDAGIDAFSACYEDWKNCDVLFASGTDPFESKTILFTEWIMRGIREHGLKVISVVPRKTTGVAYGEKHGGLYLEIIPGTDTILHMALARYIVEKDWQDQEFLDRYINNISEVNLEVFHADGFDDYKSWILNYKYSEMERASEITGIPVEKIKLAAEMIAKPKADGSRVKTSFALEKGNYWSNNYLNTASYASLGLICGAGNRPAQVISRFGGHQRGMMPGGRYPIEEAPEKFPNRKKKPIDVDRWVEDGRAKFAWVIGTTWLQAMTASERLRDSFYKMTVNHKHQITKNSVRHAIKILKKRADSGGMMVVNQNIYPVTPIGTEIADIVLPAAGWGEDNFSRANGERRIRFYSKINDAPGEAKPDWWIVANFGKRMGYSGFDWKNSNEIFEEAAWFGQKRRTSYWPLVWYAKNKKKMTGHDYLKSLGTKGIQAPVRYEDKKLVGTKRLHDSTLLTGVQDGLTTNNHKFLTEFKTSTGKANLLKTPWEIFSDFYEFMKPKGEELWVTTGRINEFWQSGFDDMVRRPYIRERWPANFIEMNSEDAKKRGIESGDLVKIHSDRIPVQVGGFDAPDDDARRGIVSSENLTMEEEPDLIMQEIATDAERKDPGVNYNGMMSDEVGGDDLLAFVDDDSYYSPIKMDPERDVETPDNIDDDILGEVSGLGISWKHIKAMTFSALQKSGHIEMTKASFEAVAIVTDAIKPGVSFTYFLVPNSAANSLAPRVLDPISQRYRFKLGRGLVERIGESPYKHDVKMMSFKSRAIV